MRDRGPESSKGAVTHEPTLLASKRAAHERKAALSAEYTTAPALYFAQAYDTIARAGRAFRATHPPACSADVTELAAFDSWLDAIEAQATLQRAAVAAHVARATPLR